MFLGDKRVQSVRDKKLSELRIGASIRRKLYELGSDEEEGPPHSPHSPPRPLSPLAAPGLRTQFGTPLARRPLLGSGRSPWLSRAKSSKDYRTTFKNKPSFKKGLKRAVTVRSKATPAGSIKKKNLERIFSSKSRGPSVRGGFNRVMSISRKQLDSITGYEADPEPASPEDQYTIYITKHNPQELWDEARLSSMKQFRISSLKGWADSDDESEEDEPQSRLWDGYLTREEQYELRKKIFHQGEYMILNYSLVLMIMTVVFTIIFVCVYHKFVENDVGMYVMCGMAGLIIAMVVVYVKVRLRLARRAPGGYKFNRKDKDTVIVNQTSEDVEQNETN